MDQVNYVSRHGREICSNLEIVTNSCDSTVGLENGKGVS